MKPLDAGRLKPDAVGYPGQAAVERPVAFDEAAGEVENAAAGAGIDHETAADFVASGQGQGRGDDRIVALEE